MSRLTLPIPSMIGGVSTQPEATRLPQQAERSDNTLGTVIEGLHRRPPAEHLSVLPLLARGAQHEMELAEGSYLMSTDGTSEFRVYDINTGEEQDVVNVDGQPLTPADLGYLDTQNPREDLRFLTLSDYTLILNRQSQVAELPNTPDRISQAIVRVTQGSYRARYLVRVRVNGATLVEVQLETYASDGSPPGSNTPGNIAEAETSVRTDIIAQELTSMLANGTQTTGLAASYSAVISGAPLGPSGNWGIDSSGSSIRIHRLDGEDFEVTVDEAIGQASTTVVGKQVQLFSDLPGSAPNGMTVEVVGDPEQSEASYWVKFYATDENTALNAWSEGYWEESVAPQVSRGMDPVTMPHALLRQENGKWRYTPLNGQDYLQILGTSQVSRPLPGWVERPVGDDETNPLPDFAGSTIRGMCFHEGRLGLVSETELVLSEVRFPFSFFRTTVLDSLDSDRIVIKAPTRLAETLHHAVPLSGDIVLFTEESQYLVRSEGAFTPSSISLVAAGNHDADPVAEPIAVRDALFVPRNVGGSGAVNALQTSGDQRPKLMNMDITASVPGYIDVPHRIITTPQLDLVVTYGEGSHELFVYSQFFDEDNAKVHQSWQKWFFASAGEILHAWFHETNLYVLAQVGEEEHVWKFRCQPEATDDTYGLTYLDQRLDSRDLPAPTVSGNTTYEFPFDPPSSLESRLQGTLKAVRVLSISGNLVTVEGDLSGSDLWFGVPFESRHDLSRISTVDSRNVPEALGILRLDTGHVQYDESGAFEVVIMDNLGNEDPHYFSGPYLGQGANYQNVRLTSGILSFPIRARSEDCRISFRSDSTEAMRLVSLDLTLRRNRTGRRQRIQ